MLYYSQATGKMTTEAGELIGVGFSGFEAMRNNPESENTLHGVIPKRIWAIGIPKPRRDSHQMILKPIDKAVPRTANGTFSIQAGELSYGCINLPKQAVAKVVGLWQKGERTLQVTG
jgi:hypothetical protein